MGGARLDQRVLDEGLAVLRRQGHLVRQRLQIEPGEDLTELIELVDVPGGHDHRPAPRPDVHASVASSCMTFSSEIPASASSSSSSSDARESGVRSAVA